MEGKISCFVGLGRKGRSRLLKRSFLERLKTCRKKVFDFLRCWFVLEGVNIGRAVFLFGSSGR